MHASSNTRRVTGASRSSPTCRGGCSAASDCRQDDHDVTSRAARRDKIFVMRKLFLVVGLFAAGCSPAMVPAPVVTAPKYPDFIRPAIPPASVNTPAAINENRGWAFLQSGDLKTA